jgi:hypothetical protein
MRHPGSLDAVLEFVWRVAPQGLVLRGVGVAAVADCWAVAGAVGDVVWPATILLALTTIAAVAQPDSSAPFAVIVMLTVTWMLEVRPLSDATHWSLALGLSVLVVHAASARAAALGDGGVIDARVARRWLLQTAMVGAATSATWGVVMLFEGASPGGGLVVSAVAIAAVAAFAVLIGHAAAESH